MIVALDANAIVDWSAAQPEDDRYQRMHLLLDRANRGGGFVVLPTPAIAEFLVKASEEQAAWLASVEAKRGVRVSPFDRRSAFECAELDKQFLSGRRSRAKGESAPHQAVKVDRQIIAIARAVGAGAIVTADRSMQATARAFGIDSMDIDGLDLPDSARQRRLDLQQSAAQLPPPT